MRKDTIHITFKVLPIFQFPHIDLEQEALRKGGRKLADFLAQSCRLFVWLKFVGTSACHTQADFLS